MRIYDISTDKLIPYANNPRINDEAVEYVKNSIKEFGFKVPIVIDKDNVVITGHTRLKACKELGITKVPCIRADDLTPEQVKAFRIADNSTGEVAKWDLGKLEDELKDLKIDLSDFGLDLGELETSINTEFESGTNEGDEDDGGYYGDERERTFNAYNMHLVDYVKLTNDFWQMPIIKKETFIPDDLIGFKYAMRSQYKKCGLHCFIDDYQFERLWSRPDNYIDLIKEYQCFLSPDFSLYLDMTTPVKIWNVYRSRLLGAYYQALGIKVIPTLQWAEKKSFQYCFKGIEKGGVVAISTIGVKEDENALKCWREGLTEAIKQVEPKTILIYGGKLEYDYGNVETIYFENHQLEKWHNKEDSNE